MHDCTCILWMRICGFVVAVMHTRLHFGCAYVSLLSPRCMRVYTLDAHVRVCCHCGVYACTFWMRIFELVYRACTCVFRMYVRWACTCTFWMRICKLIYRACTCVFQMCVRGLVRCACAHARVHLRCRSRFDDEEQRQHESFNSGIDFTLYSSISGLNEGE